MSDSTSTDVVSLRPFVPATNLDTSLRFYGELGFVASRLSESLASMQLGPFGFLLQQFEAKGFATNFMMQLLVTDLDGWWMRIERLQLAEKYGIRPPRAPSVQPWGLTVAYLHDPSGVLWHITQQPGPART